jgi:hypothetical protein
MLHLPAPGYPISLRRFVSVRLAYLFCSLMFLAVACRGEIGIGDAREDVLRQLGKPTSIARRGDHEIFLYPKGGRIEFVGGKVADVKGPLPTPILPPPDPAPSAPPVTQASAPAPKASTPAKTTPSKQTPDPKPAVTSPSGEFNPAAASEEIARHVEKMETPWGMAPQREAIHSPLDSLPEFLTGLAMRFAFTVLALKLAFKYWEMDAFWTGVFLIAGIDLTLHAMLELLGPVSGGFTTMVGVENGIPGLVLIYTINRFCFNKRIQNAVITAAAVKLVVTLFYIFAGIAALNLIYG